MVNVVQNPNAKMHKRLQYNDVMTQNLRVMDETAITLCKENEIPVRPPCICFWCKSFILHGVPDTQLHLHLDAEQCFPSITLLKRWSSYDEFSQSGMCWSRWWCSISTLRGTSCEHCAVMPMLAPQYAAMAVN